MTYRDSAVAIYILYFFLSNTILYRFETMCYWCSMFFMWNWIFFLYLHRYTAQYFIKFESLSNQSDGSFLLRTFEIVHNAWNDFEPTVLTMLCLQLCWASSYEKNRISFLRTLVECDWNKPKKKKKAREEMPNIFVAFFCRLCTEYRISNKKQWRMLCKKSTLVWIGSIKMFKYAA